MKVPILLTYLLLFPELHLHLLVPQLVLANTVACDEVAADVSQLWVLLARLFDQTEEDTKRTFWWGVFSAAVAQPKKVNYSACVGRITGNP